MKPTFNQQFHHQKFIQWITSCSFSIAFEFGEELNSWCKNVEKMFSSSIVLTLFLKYWNLRNIWNLKEKGRDPVGCFLLFPKRLIQYHFLNMPSFSWFEMLCVLRIKFSSVLLSLIDYFDLIKTTRDILRLTKVG